MGNYLWDLEQQADLARAEGRQAVGRPNRIKDSPTGGTRARPSFTFAGSHRVLAAFVAGLGYRMIETLARMQPIVFSPLFELSPMNGEAWLELTWCLAELGRWEECELAARKSTEIFPKTAASWGNLAIALGRVGKMIEAKQAIQRAIQLDPADARNRAISETIVPRTGDKG